MVIILKKISLASWPLQSSNQSIRTQNLTMGMSRFCAALIIALSASTISLAFSKTSSVDIDDKLNNDESMHVDCKNGATGTVSTEEDNICIFSTGLQTNSECQSKAQWTYKEASRYICENATPPVEAALEIPSGKSSLRDKDMNLANIAPSSLSGTLNSTSSSTPTVNSFETGWNGFTNNGPFQFYRRSGSTPSPDTGPTTGANNTAHYLFLETSSGAAYNNGNTAYIQKNWIGSNAVTFYYHMYGSNIGELSLQIYSNGGWKTIWTLDGQQHNASAEDWKKQTVSLAFYASPKTVRFVGVAAGGFRGDIAIDEITFHSLSTTSSKSYKYDELGRLVCSTDTINGSRTFDLDAAGNRTNVSTEVCDD